MRVLSACMFCGGRLGEQWGSPSFARCRGCDLIFRNPFPSDEDLAELYRAAWTKPDQSSSETGGMDSFLAHQYVLQAQRSLGLKSFERFSILDFGAGDGALLEQLQLSGAQCAAVEPFGYEKLIAKGIRAFASLDSLPEGELFDGIFCMDVAEHLRRPWDVFSELCARLKPGGWCILATPNPHGLHARLRAGRWREAQKKGHIIFLGERALRKCLESAGFSSIRSMRWRIKHNKGFVTDRFVHPLLRVVSRLNNIEGAVRVIGFRSRSL